MDRPHLLNPRLPALWHGGDYSPEQWPETIWDEDVWLMREARFRVATLGVFSWARLEPAEGRFEFGWLDGVVERLSAADRYFVLAAPSAAPPAWMSRKYPEILRTGADRVRNLHGNRVNYAMESPVYRERTRDMARRLAERYGDHPRLLAWHVSNEYGGADYGPYAVAAFRRWLRAKYGSLDRLNAAYWTAFWSHAFSEWDEIDAPGAPYGETAIQGLTVDWQRFTTDSTVEFMRNEAVPLRELSPGVPVTTNFMGTYPGLDYRRFAPHLDFACWDSYPAFGSPLDRTETWVAVAFKHDLTRGLNADRKWMMMECTPSSSNWYPTMSLKRPGMHRFEALQAVAHGADGVQYFQWRQSRGSQEQIHGAVVNHGTKEDGRVSGEVREVGIELEGLDGLVGSRVGAEVAIVYDWEARWALDAACGPIQGEKGYEATCVAHYRPFWEAGIPLGPLREVLGLWSEELDALPTGKGNRVEVQGMGSYAATEFCELIHLTTARVLGVYEDDFYAGRPALTVNEHGAGRAYYVASRNEAAFADALLRGIAHEAGVAPIVEGLPPGVTAQRRAGEEGEWIFRMNSTPDRQVVGMEAEDVELEPWGVAVRARVAVRP